MNTNRVVLGLLTAKTPRTRRYTANEASQNAMKNENSGKTITILFISKPNRRFINEIREAECENRNRFFLKSIVGIYI